MVPQSPHSRLDGRGRARTERVYDLELSVAIAARPETIFRFFSQPALFSNWLAAKAEYEPRPGSPLRIDFPECASVIAGTIVAVEPNRRLVFTWGETAGEHEVSMPAASTQVEITLTPHADGTLVTLRHSGLPSQELRDEHIGGWRHYLCQLSLQATGDELGDRVQNTVQSYLEAWNVPDAGVRRRLLAEVWHPQGRLEDPFAFLTGIDSIDQHIESARLRMPGVRVELAGAVELCHANVRFAWRVTDPAGNCLVTGTNFAAVTPDGRLAKVVGFWDAPAARG